MKKFMVQLLIIFLMSSLSLAQDSIKSLLGVSFGEICTVKGEFVDKPNTYYAQNMSSAPYFLKISEINQIKLEEPLIVEPVCGKMEIEKNKIYIFHAYEEVRSEGEPEGWSLEAQQFYYTLKRKIVVKAISPAMG